MNSPVITDLFPTNLIIQDHHISVLMKKKRLQTENLVRKKHREIRVGAENFPECFLPYCERNIIADDWPKGRGLKKLFGYSLFARSPTLFPRLRVASDLPERVKQLRCSGGGGCCWYVIRSGADTLGLSFWRWKMFFFFSFETRRNDWTFRFVLDRFWKWKRKVRL